MHIYLKNPEPVRWFLIVKTAKKKAPLAESVFQTKAVITCWLCPRLLF